MERAWVRFCPLDSGKEFGRKVFCKAVQFGLIPQVWHEFQPGLWMRINLGDYPQQDLLVKGIWEPAETLCLEQRLKPGDVFIDIGANAGYFSLIASKLVGSEGKVIAFEPNPSLARALQLNLVRSEADNVSVEQAACSNSDQPVSLYISPSSNSGKTSLFPTNAKSATHVIVPTTPLDAFAKKFSLDRIDMVKIDVEGAELLVLEGMEECLRRFRPQVILELEPALMAAAGTCLQDFFVFFNSCGYELQLLDAPNYLASPREGAAERSA
jgi:FkbM family methyltransferase